MTIYNELSSYYMKLPVYLDNHSTTQLDERVLRAMLPYMQERYGNASSKEHSFGWFAEEAVKNAREIIAGFINAKPEEIIFTSGTTESNNHVIFGLAENYGDKINHIITTPIEHPSVLEPLKILALRGFNITFLSVDKYGMINPEELKTAITEKTFLVSIMTANNEIGTIQPIKQVGAICKEKNIIFHTDAAQAIGKTEFDVDKFNIDLASFNVHKNYGPKGIGALFIKKKNPKINLPPLLYGGGQQNNSRPGTLNVPAIVGFGKAIEISQRNMKDEIERIIYLRDKLYNSVKEKVDEVFLNGHPYDRLPNNLNISIGNINVDSLILELRDVAFSTGSACASGNAEPSHVLKAIGVKKELLHSTIRFGLGRFTSEEEIDFCIHKITDAVIKIRNKIFAKTNN
jgi:cysteine desulfurase